MSTMAPVRTSTRSNQPEASSSKVGITSKPRKSKGHPPKEQAGVPGVQKLKASLRQTRRLLAKDTIAADVRVETERRLKALEAELQQAELTKKERALAVRYHKIKFFERQKVVRKLKQMKKQLLSEGSTNTEELEAALLELRVDLNYIMHYPKTKKYISLFPPELRNGETATEESQSDKAKTDTEREEVRNWIRGCMEKGELPPEPEMHLESGIVQSKKVSRSKTWESSQLTGNKVLKATPQEDEDDVGQDDFFGDDDEE
ncbi:hypothetical protein BDQ12DRAFT_673900 [Crucibulum laeve]|uniref:rRNA-processing protein EFG1 n=1 Tax=Crucibulum laeve TaxID=68775 RepID=A0A5C3MHS5_9AGAR|nr:hypothetical protein BDQ12DRAFT_673900 [Crucibulum laeve]